MRWFGQSNSAPGESDRASGEAGTSTSIRRAWVVVPCAEGLKYVRDAERDGTEARGSTGSGRGQSEEDAAGGRNGVAASIIEPAFVQWADAGQASEDGGRWLVTWSALYELLADPEVRPLASCFGFPPLASLSPRLVSQGSLSDQKFTIAVDGWLDGTGRDVGSVALTGALVIDGTQLRLLPEATYALLRRVSEFFRRPAELRDERSNRLAWGEIRRLALAANARLDNFLVRTVVLSPERLKIGLRRNGEPRSQVAGSTVIEVVPGFDGCPDAWLAAFDAQTSVRDRYDVPTAEGVVQIIVRPEVRAILEQIKRMKGRRVAGARAEAFITNPFAALGEAAAKVIDPDEFEAERERAGLQFDRFTSYVERDSRGRATEFGLIIENGSGPETRSFRQSLSIDEANEFIARVRAHLAQNHQLCAWREFEFELLGNVAQELETLERAVASAGASPSIVFGAVYDLSIYSERIHGIGLEEPYVSAHIARKDESVGWFPDNLVDIIELPPDKPGGEPRHLALGPEQLRMLGERVRAAKARGDSTVRIPAIEDDIPVADLEGVLNTFAEVRRDAENGVLGDRIRAKAHRKLRKGLLIKPNIAAVDYLEVRRERLLTFSRQCDIPRSLRPETTLKQHQRAGVAWLQHLFSLSPDECRGALLADDMGLGKTLQLLTLIAWAHDRDPQLAPALIVAPVALLENWREEIEKFLTRDSLRVLEVYGDALAALRVPREEVDEQLKRDGLVRFLQPGWVGSAQIVLTTYETLRDLEFSFAAEKWSVVVCDEAQKAKNPNALITRAIKKQNARFRVACTGTPVENTLADLWCLFDFVQPGLLGALNEFGGLYRRPIEAKSDEERVRVEELRAVIKPQILRRLKADVATDLPRKVEVVEGCKGLALTALQRNLYAQAISQFSRRADPSAVTPFKSPLGLLHYLRLICTDPRPHGLSGHQIEPIGSYRAKAPKLDWLLNTLRDIRRRQEKALVFCEFKDIQRLLRHYIEEELGYAADIINGDTAASSSNDNSRQKRIRVFQRTPGFGVLILSPLAVGFGVNIQAANHVIHYTRTWNPAKEDQATDRAYRIGQEKDVFVYCPVVAASDFKTFDVKLDELLRYKRSLATDMLNGSGDLGANDFDIGDVAPPGSHDGRPRELTFDDVMNLQPRHFEAYVAVLWNCQGYRRVTLTPASGDGGIDVLALKESEGELIQCKTARHAGRELGWDAIKDVVTGEAGYRQRYPNVEFRKVCVTTQRFNSTARSQAELNRVRLVDETALEALHRAYSITLEQVERVLYSA